MMCRLLDSKLDNETCSIMGDSKLVIEQLSGNWGIKSGKYLRYAERALNLLLDFRVSPVFNWIPKESNSEADKLSRRYI